MNKLEQARKDKQLANLTYAKEIENLKHQLAEAEKPEMKQGDYRIATNGTIYLIVADHGTLRLVQNGELLIGSLEGYSVCSGKEAMFSGNLDDLKALKPLSEFEMTEEDTKVSIDKDGDLRIEDDDDGNFILINSGNIHDFILNLRCMELKVKLDAAKQ